MPSFRPKAGGGSGGGGGGGGGVPPVRFTPPFAASGAGYVPFQHNLGTNAIGAALIHDSYDGAHRQIASIMDNIYVDDENTAFLPDSVLGWGDNPEVVMWAIQSAGDGAGGPRTYFHIQEPFPDGESWDLHPIVHGLGTVNVVVSVVYIDAAGGVAMDVGPAAQIEDANTVVLNGFAPHAPENGRAIVQITAAD